MFKLGIVFLIFCCIYSSIAFEDKLYVGESYTRFCWTSDKCFTNCGFTSGLRPQFVFVRKSTRSYCTIQFRKERGELRIVEHVPTLFGYKENVLVSSGVFSKNAPYDFIEFIGDRLYYTNPRYDVYKEKQIVSWY